MAAFVVLELPPDIRETHSFVNAIVGVEHRKDPIMYYGSKVPTVSLSPSAEKLGVFLGFKPLFGNLFTFLILFEGVAHFGIEGAPGADIKPWQPRHAGLLACGANRVYVAPTLIAPLPILR